MKSLLYFISHVFCIVFLQPQKAMPDVFIWLLSGGKRKCYVKIPVEEVMYSPLVGESGINAGKIQTYLLSVSIIWMLGVKV